MEQSSFFEQEAGRENRAVKTMWFLFGKADATCGSCASFTAATATTTALCGHEEARGVAWRSWFTACGRHRIGAL